MSERGSNPDLRKNSEQEQRAEAEFAKKFKPSEQPDFEVIDVDAEDAEVIGSTKKEEPFFGALEMGTAETERRMEALQETANETLGKWRTEVYEITKDLPTDIHITPVDPRELFVESLENPKDAQVKAVFERLRNSSYRAEAANLLNQLDEVQDELRAAGVKFEPVNDQLNQEQVAKAVESQVNQEMETIREERRVEAEMDAEMTKIRQEKEEALARINEAALKRTEEQLAATQSDDAEKKQAN